MESSLQLKQRLRFIIYPFVVVVFIALGARWSSMCFHSEGGLECPPSGGGLESPPSYAATSFMGEQRNYPGGTFSVVAFQEMYRQFDRNTAEMFSSPDSAWHSIGPTNVAGRVLAVAINPERPTEIWVGTASGGLWKLIDSGTSYHWYPIDTHFPTQSVGAIYIDSVNRNLIYIGTGEVYSYTQGGAPGVVQRTMRGFYGTGIYKTTDNGVSWSQVLSFPDTAVCAVNKILASPRSVRTLYAATTQGIYKSDDQGASWRRLNSLPETMAMDIVIDRIDTARLFVSCGDQDAGSAGIYRTTDAGSHWSKLDVGTINFTGRSGIAVSATNRNNIYAGISDRFATQGLYQSSDGGNEWRLADTTNYTQFQGWYSNVVEVRPYFVNEVWCGGIELWQLGQNNAHMQRIDHTPAGYHVDIHALTYQKSDTNLKTFYLGTDGGVFKTTDDGMHFRDMNSGFVSTQFYDGFVNLPGDSVGAYGGLQDNGTYKYTGNKNWQFSLGGDGSWCAVAPTNPAIVLAQYTYINPTNPLRGGVELMRSTDGGNTFALALLDTSDAVSFTTPVIAAPTNHVMYCGTSVVRKSTNDGATWSTTLTSPLDEFVLGSNPCIALATSHTSSDTVYAATAPLTHAAGIFATFDGGVTWDSKTRPIPNRYPTHLAVSAKNSSVVYVTFSGFGTGHVFRTTNAGGSWTDITNNLPDLPTNTVLPDPLDTANIYVGNDLGVYASTDGGAHWAPFSTGMPAAIVMSLTITDAGRMLRVATHGRGVYERPAIAAKVGVSEALIPATNEMRVYPTIVNRSGTLTIENAGAGSSRNEYFSVYNAAGECVLTKTLNSNDITSAPRIQISTKGLESGVYTIRLSNPQSKVSRFLVVN